MRENASWTHGVTGKSYNCGYGKSSKDNLIFAGTKLYHAGSPVRLREEEDIELGSLIKSPFVFFSTCEARVRQFGGTMQVFELKKNLPATYSGKRGGFDQATEFFKDVDNVAYFCDKECEVVIRTTFIDDYLKTPTSLSSALWYYLCCCCR